MRSRFRVVGRLLAPVLGEIILPIVAVDHAAACLAVSPPTWQYTEPPQLVLTAVIVAGRHAPYTARVETLIRGHAPATFTIVSESGCDIPAMRPGQRIALLAAGVGQGNPFTMRHRVFSSFTGPIWLIDHHGAFTQAPRADRIGPPVNGVTARSLAEVLVIVGLPEEPWARPVATLSPWLGSGSSSWPAEYSC